MNHSDALRVPVGPRPVDRATEHRRKGGQATEPDESLRGPFAAAATDDVEDPGAGPSPDRKVGEHGMQRMTQPDAVQGVSQRTRRYGALDDLRQASGSGVEARLVLDAIHEALHARHR